MGPGGFDVAWFYLLSATGWSNAGFRVAGELARRETLCNGEQARRLHELFHHPKVKLGHHPE